jgi:hypothetical protein
MKVKSMPFPRFLCARFPPQKDKLNESKDEFNLVKDELSSSKNELNESEATAQGASVLPMGAGHLRQRTVRNRLLIGAQTTQRFQLAGNAMDERANFR